MTGSTIKDAEGKPLYFSATAIDISELKHTEKALRKQTLRNQLILQTAMNGFYIIDMDGKILEANQSASMITGYPKKELVGANILDFEAKETPSVFVWKRFGRTVT
jgi:PAS domain-containing protein